MQIYIKAAKYFPLLYRFILFHYIIIIAYDTGDRLQLSPLILSELTLS